MLSEWCGYSGLSSVWGGEMITWVTVWVLTMVNDNYFSGTARRDSYQLTYANQETCIKQGERIKKTNETYSYRCDFQQVPMVVR